MTTRTRLSVLLISTPLLAFIVIGGMLGRASSGDDTFRHLGVFSDVVSLILNNYVEEVKVDHVMEGAMRGLADGLDPDSAYLTAEEVKAVDQSGPCASLFPTAACSNGEPAGDVGLELTRQYYLRVIAARDGSPAAKAGLQTGDYVRAIDGKPTRDMSVWEGARMLRGTPGSRVTLTIIRANAADPHDVPLVRETTPGTLVTGRMLPPDIGVIRIASFGTGTAQRVRDQVTELAKQGAKNLIIDLRRTAEGPYESGIETARLFIKEGTIVQLAGRDPQQQKTTDEKMVPPIERSAKVPPSAIRQTITANAGDGSVTLPVTLLVTTGTSGAAELVVAALEGHKRADIVGERTLGRAGVQKLVRLPDGRGLWLTYQRYVTPDGNAISGHGIAPAQEVDEPDVEWGEPAPAGDPILDAAVARIRKNAA
jgi:carboxyl-terminal processing protease